MLLKIRWSAVLSRMRLGAIRFARSIRDAVQGLLKESLRNKIIAWSFVPTAIILVAVALVTFFAYQRVTEELVIERDQDLTRLTAGQLATELAEYADVLTTVARTADIYRGDSAAQRDALKRSSIRLTVFDAGVLILDTRGKVVAAEPERPDALGQDWSDHECYHELFRSERLDLPRSIFSNIVADGPQGVEVVCVAEPVIGEQGELVGAMVGMFRLGATAVSPFYGKFVKLRIGENGKAYLVDANGRVIYHSDTGRIGEDFFPQAAVQRVLSGQVGALRTRDSEGLDIVASFAPVPGTPWGLVNEESWAALTGGSRGYQQFLLLLLALGVAVPIFVVTVGVRRITRPILELIHAAQEVARGNFGQTITVRTRDEVEALARQFNLMSAHLQESYTHLEQRVADRTKELEALNAIAAVVSQSLDLDEILHDALDKTLQVMEIEAGGIYLLDEEAGLLTIAAQRGFSPQFVTEIDRLKVGEGFSGRVAQSGQPLVVRNIPADPRLTRTIVREEGLRSVAVVPLSSKGKVLGTLFTSTHGYREFTDQDVQLLTSIGHQIGVAIDNARFFEAEQRRAEQFRVISEVGRSVTSLLAVDEILQQIVRLVKDTLGYHQVAIGLIEGDELVFRAAAGVFWEGLELRPLILKIGREGITGLVAQSGESLLVPDVSQEPRYYRVPADTKTKSELAVPLKTKEAVIGVMAVSSDRLAGFDETDLAVLESVGHQAAMAIEIARLFEAEQRRAEQFRVISEVGHRITSILAVEELLEQMTRLIKKAFNYYGVGIGLIDGDELVFNAGAGSFWDDPQFQSLSLQVGQQGITGWVAATGEPLLVPDVSQEPRYYLPPLPQARKTRSELAVPLKTKGKVIGVLDVASDRMDAFAESDLVVLQSLANQAAVAIENARLFDGEQRRAEQFWVISAVGRQIASILDINEVLVQLVRLIQRAFDYDHVGIALIEGDEAVYKVGAGYLWDDPEFRFRPARLKVGQEGIAGWVAAAGEPLLVPDVSTEPRYVWMRGSKTRSELAVPIKVKGEVIGVLDVQSNRMNGFDHSDLVVLQSLAVQAGIALQNARLYEQAQQLAVMEERNRLARDLHDAVTQTLFSASLIAEALPAVWESDQEEGTQLLRELRQLSRGALAEMRTLLLELRPAALVEANLGDLLRQLAEAITGRTGLRIAVTVEGWFALPPDVHVALYRIAQEALNNVVKHAQASQVTVSLHYTSTPSDGGEGQHKRIELHVSDDGRGFDPRSVPPDRMGLGILRERARAIGATLNLESQPGQGAQVVVAWEEGNIDA